MPTVQEVCSCLESLAPSRLAESWDNVGLLVGDTFSRADSIMTCLTITPESAAEAIEHRAQLVVTHHPLPFRPLQRITTDATPSKLLWDLIRAGVSVYSAHTAYDSAVDGINQSLARRLGLAGIEPLNPIADDPDKLGAGRFGLLKPSIKLEALVQKTKREFNLAHVQVVGEANASIALVAIACGSGGSFLETAAKTGCDVLITGEATFHTCVEASATKIAMILMGHFSSERFGIELLADKLRTKFQDTKVWASQHEVDPIRIV